jgi:hypothetical protein
MISPKTDNCRILFQNINGISNDSLFTDATLLHTTSSTLNVDILGLIETNIDWEKQNVRQQCKYAMRSKTPNKIQFSSYLQSTANTNSTYLPGGTLTLVHSPWSSRTSSTSDPSGMGRWSEVTLNGKDKCNITIITAYRVCDSSSSAHDSNTAYNQQWRHLTLQDIPNPCPRQQMLDDLTLRIAELQQASSEIIILIDANESSNKSNGPLLQWIQRNNLIDVLLAHHGTTGEPETYIRGSHRIDYIFATHKILEFIQRSGILPYNSLGKGDHRPLYIDVDLHTYLKNYPSTTNQKVVRGVNTNNPRAVKLYRKRLQHFFQTSHFNRDMERLQSIIDNINGPLPQRLQDEYNRIDKWFTTTCIKFDKECSRLPNIEWSPALIIAKHNSMYWNMWITELQTGRELSTQRQELASHLQPTKRQLKLSDIQQRYSLPSNRPSHPEAHKQQRLAKHHLRQTIHQATQLREEHLQRRAEAAMDIGQTNIAQIIQKIKHSEKQKRATSHIRSIMKPEQSGGISHILTDNIDGSLTSTFDEETIHKLIIQRNINHFSQAESTPLTVAPLKTILGPYATSDASSAILDGTYDIDSINTTQAMKDILFKCKRIVPAHSVDCLITTEDVRNGFKAWRESTTTSPSNLHLGHAKACFHFDYTDNDKSDTPTTPLSTQVFSYQAALMNNAIQHNFVPERWTQVLNIMLEKSPGFPYLPKLRIIQITEKDENLLTGITIGRRLVSHGEMLHAFGDEQGGSRPDRQTGEISLFKHFMFSISRTTQTDLATFDNDAKSCYDRIVMTLASLSAQRLGIDPKVCELLLHILHSHKHKISTQHGTSTEHFTSNESKPIHGPGQGGKSSSAIWMIISTLLMECMANQSDGATFTDPSNSTLVQQRMTGFVDDTTHWINNDIRHPSTANIIPNNMKRAAQYWEQLLHASGGKLELTKCFFYHMKWSFSSEGTPQLDILNNDELSTTIIDSETSLPIQINALQSNISHKTLGILETPNGNNNDEYLRLQNKSKTMARSIAAATISSADASTLYYTMFLPSITYSLTVGTLTKKQLNQIQVPVKEAILPKLGFNRHFPLEVTYGPKNIGGLGLRHLFAEQGTIKAIILIKQLRINRPLGKLSRIKLAWDQRVAGIGHSILRQPFKHCPQLHSELWTTTLREFLKASELEIYISNFHTPIRQRQHDIILMDSIAEHPKLNFTDQEIRMINRCRIFLQCETLADITNMLGTTIQPQAYTCNPAGKLTNNGIWPQQPIIGPVHRRIWKRFLQTFLQDDLKTLLQPLGKWTTAISSQQWTTYINHSESTVMIHTDSRWTQHQLQPATRHGYPIGPSIPFHNNWKDQHHRTHQPTDSTSNASNRTYIIDTIHLLPLQTHIPTIIPPYIAPNFDEKFQQHISKQPAWETALLINVTCIVPIEQLFESLANAESTLYIVSDGGCISPHGSFGWVLSTEHQILIENQGTASGIPMTSYRAEATGKLSWILFLKQLHLLFPYQPKCKILNFLDNSAVVKQTSITINHTYASMALKPDYDLLIAIQHEQQYLITNGIHIGSSIHVKGHQDDTTPYHDLSRPAQLNIRADELATNALNTAKLTTIVHQLNPITSIINPHCYAYLMEHGRPIMSNEQIKLRWKWSELTLQTYYMHRFKLNAHQLHNINWAGIQLARQTMSQPEVKFIIKRTTDWLPVGHNMEKQKHIITNCHRCNGHETFEHLYICNENLDDRTAFLTNLTTTLKSANTSPDIQKAITHGACAWLNFPQPNPIPESLQSTYDTQTIVGWKLFFKGLLVQQWSQHQQAFIDIHSTSSHYTGDTWNKQICKFLLQQAHQMWISRCNEVHANSDTNNISKANQEANAQLKRIYDSALTLPTHNQQSIFHTPLTEHIAKGTRHIRQWITRNAAIIRHMTSQTAQHHSGQLTLLKFWQRKKPSTPKINNTPQSEQTVLR